MILKSLDFKGAGIELKRTVADVPQFGEGAQVTLTQLSIKGYLRKNKLHSDILKRGLDESQATLLVMCAALMCAMIDPDTGDFLVGDDQLEYFAENVSVDTLEALVLANNIVNPAPGFETLDAKKK